MTDQAGGIPDFLQRKPEAPTPPKLERQPRQRRAPKPTAAETASEPPKPKKPRKARKVPTKERSTPETVKVTLKEYAQMRIAPAAKEFVKIHKIMSSVAGIARGKLLAELNKVFG